MAEPRYSGAVIRMNAVYEQVLGKRQSECFDREPFVCAARRVW